MTALVTDDLLNAALIGYELQRDKMDLAINDIRQQLKQLGANGTKKHLPSSSILVEGAPVRKKRRPMSPAARKRIALAQKKRWADYHKQQNGA